MKKEQYAQQMIADLKEIVNIASVYSKDDQHPYGEKIDLCLKKMLQIMDRLGFETYYDPDGQYGYAQVGEGEMFGILGHLDVVNARAEDGWNTPPFTLTEVEGNLYGRGTQDDKGPMISAIYAVKALMDENVKFNKKIRFIFGVDEETLWRSIAHYTEKEEAPKMGFTPDSAFPLTYAEKGLLQILIKDSKPAIYAYSGGDTFNAVSTFANCNSTGEIENALNKFGYEYTLENGILNVSGVSAHAKNPWLGTSANLRLAHALQEAGFTDNSISFINEILFDKFRFEGFTTEDLSDFSGSMSINMGKMKADENGTTLSVDLRLPVSQSKEGVLAIIADIAGKYNLQVEEYDWLRSIYVPLDSFLVSNLLSSYREVTGDTTSEPHISAGATYARAFDNCVAFGANFPGAPTSEHQPNEFISKENLLLSSQIYYTAIKKLTVE